MALHNARTWAASTLLCAGLAGCQSPAAVPPTTGAVRGAVDARGTDSGNAFVFLYPGGHPPAPRGDGRPIQIGAVPAQRLYGEQGPDALYTIENVAPGPYLARAIVNTRGTFDPFVDVLAQPFAGDLDDGLLTARVEAGAESRVDFASPKRTEWDPPMFIVDSNGGRTVTLAANEQSLVIMHLKAQALPFGIPERTAFVYGSVDADGDGHLDDDNHDGTPDTFPTVILQRIAQDDDGPEYKDEDGKPLQIVIPTTVQPDPAGRNDVLGTRQVVNGLYVLIAPVAAVVLPADVTGKVRTRQLPSLPVGQYQITVLTGEGQYWQIPNGLGPDGLFAANHGGPYASQSARFAVLPAR